ncbi:MAG: (Fe-S)-binding protein [Anaerolineales bacterium]|jgi:L-lactate dehydrogenase complex protein LldE
MAKTVQFFVTCLVDTFFPQVGLDSVELLRRAGAQVNFPTAQTCCGQPAFNAGQWELARTMACHTIEVLESLPGSIVLPSGSCADMIKHGYLQLFSGQPHWLRRARALSERTFELSQFLIDQLHAIPPAEACPHRLSYHPSCHLLRNLGVDEQPIKLLTHQAAPSVHRLDPDCCGFGGVFAVDHAPISSAILGVKLDQIQKADVERVVGCDVSCLMHIEGGLRQRGSSVRTLHLAQVLMGHWDGLR